MRLKGRARALQRDENPNTKISSVDVYHARYLRKRGWTLVKIARRFGVGTSTIHRVTTSCH
jgi:hypothetical protein